MTDKVAERGSSLRAMIEITLPCCNAPIVIQPDAVEVECEACGLVLELAPDARLTFVAEDDRLLAAA